MNEWKLSQHELWSIGPFKSSGLREFIDKHSEAIAHAQAKKLVEFIEGEFCDSDSTNMWYVNKRFWQQLRKEVGLD